MFESMPFYLLPARAGNYRSYHWVGSGGRSALCSVKKIDNALAITSSQNTHQKIKARVVMVTGYYDLV